MPPDRDDPDRPGAPAPAEPPSSDASGSGARVAAVPDELPREGSRPLSGGRPATASDADTRSRRLADAAKEAIDVGVTKLSTGIGTIGGGVSKLGEGVSKLGDLSRGVPVVGASVSKLGEGITHVGDSLNELPKVARTRRGRLLIRSMAVGFLLVASWIVVIVALQLHGNDLPDFRPNAERILSELSKGAIDDVYEQASPRFQEMVRKEKFVDDMTDLSRTVGTFREITSVNDSIVTSGASGRVGRVSLTAAYTKGTCKVSVSLHEHHGRWKLLGVGVELPPELKISQAQREARVKLCDDPMDLRRCDAHRVVDAILRLLRDGHADQVWDAATPVFQQHEERAKFVQLQAEHLGVLGSYRRIIAVSEAKSFSNATSATFDTLAEFERASGVRVVFGLSRPSKLAAWQLASLKIAMPMPRGADELAAEHAADGPPPAPGEPTAPTPTPPSPSPSRPGPSASPPAPRTPSAPGGPTPKPSGPSAGPKPAAASTPAPAGAVSPSAPVAPSTPAPAGAVSPSAPSAPTTPSAPTAPTTPSAPPPSR